MWAAGKEAYRQGERQAGRQRPNPRPAVASKGAAEYLAAAAPRASRTHAPAADHTYPDGRVIETFTKKHFDTQ